MFFIFTVTTVGFTVKEFAVEELTYGAVITLLVTGADLELEKIIVNISTHDISAQGNVTNCSWNCALSCSPIGGLDYASISDEQLTFSADLLEMDIMINIIDDFLFERDEAFIISIQLISEPFTGLRLQNNITITIVDNDGMSAACMQGEDFTFCSALCRSNC